MSCLTIQDRFGSNNRQVAENIVREVTGLERFDAIQVVMKFIEYVQAQAMTSERLNPGKSPIHFPET